MDTERAAVIRGDAISELSYSPLKVRLKGCLVHDQHFAARPLFEPMQNGRLIKPFPRILQLNEDLYLTGSKLFLENYRLNRVFHFKIASSFYIFINYALAGQAEDVVKLSLSLFSINETISRRDYIADAAAIDYESVEDRNLNAILGKLATANLNNQRIQTFIDSQSIFISMTSAGFLPSDVSHLL